MEFTKLEQAIINMVPEGYGDSKESSIKDWLTDIAIYGCRSGAVSDLIYASDCEKFLACYTDEIEEVIFNHLKELDDGESKVHFVDRITSTYYIFQNMVWFAVELVAFSLESKIE